MGRVAIWNRDRNRMGMNKSVRMAHRVVTTALRSCMFLEDGFDRGCEYSMIRSVMKIF